MLEVCHSEPPRAEKNLKPFISIADTFLSPDAAEWNNRLSVAFTSPGIPLSARLGRSPLGMTGLCV